MDRKSDKKNKPTVWIVILFSLIPLTVAMYFILQMIFPGLFQSLPSGEIQPVHPEN
ncbi:hypothetical protein [Chryseobacterium sp. Leaf394]|uniref:hypothetical protein n=1 Tax=Chryseobacterium sp. Leaf394 TaxID=1736361 RepID=UPI000B10C0A8|nr:hypothetical protein [Chryseobacterium sp. Leaf394]